MVTVYDVAQATGLSIASVSRALNGQPGVSATTAERILRIAADLGYQPNEVARSLVAGFTQTIALLVPDITNPFFPELVKGVQSVADENDQLLLLVDAPRDRDKLRARLAALRRKQVDGVLLVASEMSAAAGNLFGDIPGVYLDRAGSGDGPSVCVDQEEAARTATSHLFANGHRKVAHIMGPPELAVSQLRRRGWERACRDAGVTPDDSLVAHGDFLEEGGYRAGEELLARRHDVTAVFAANDLSAIGFIAFCAASGRSVPDDVSVVGLDGIELSRFVSPVLTTVAQPIRALGEQACALLLSLIEGKAAQGDIILPAELVEGSSVRQITEENR